ncbi:hypothetical protein HK405_013178, partial [Cladochytrium tenue]
MQPADESLVSSSSTAAAAAAACWDPCVELLLRGALLSRTSPLRVLRHDADALRMVVASVRSVAHPDYLDWTQRGVWPCVASVYFPPPLVRGRSLDAPVRRGPNSVSATTNMLAGTDFDANGVDFDPEIIDTASDDGRRSAFALWKGLLDWAESMTLHQPVPANDQKRKSTRFGADIDRQALVAALGDLVEPFHVNMLPIVMGSHTSLPDKCKRYSALINRCLYHCPEEAGKVGYLTIHEGYVEPGSSQRRPGLHIESPGFFEGH